MRYAIISDLHSNRQALTAVLADIKNMGVDEIVCLGDVIGYGPSPAEVFDLARDNVNHFIMGNHDAVVAGMMSPENFNDNAKFLIEWTCSALEKSGAADFFNTVPLVLKGNDLRFSHGEFENPGRFGYIIENDEALASFNFCSETLLLTGHSHVPGIFVIGDSGVPHWLAPQNFGLEEGKRYIVNAGSVGQPRDDDVRASYCIYDVIKKDIFFRKVPFNVSLFRDDLVKNSLPETAYFLTLDKAAPPASAKELIEFTPLTADTSVKMDIEVQDLQQTVAELKKSKIRLLVLLILMIIVFVGFGLVFFLGVFDNKKTPEVYRVNSVLSTLAPDLRSLTVGRELLSMPVGITKSVSKETPLDKWGVTITNPELQKVSVIKEVDSKENEEYVFSVRSSEESLVEISSLPIPATKGMRFNATCGFKKIRYDSGFVALLLQQQLEDGTWKTIMRKEPKNFVDYEEWGRMISLTQPTNTPLTADDNIRLTIRIRLLGEVQIRKCKLKRKL
jgi:predicted phosphodiesterase